MKDMQNLVAPTAIQAESSSVILVKSSASCLLSEVRINCTSQEQEAKETSGLRFFANS